MPAGLFQLPQARRQFTAERTRVTLRAPKMSLSSSVVPFDRVLDAVSPLHNRVYDAEFVLHPRKGDEGFM